MPTYLRLQRIPDQLLTTHSFCYMYRKHGTVQQKRKICTDNYYSRNKNFKMKSLKKTKL